MSLLKRSTFAQKVEELRKVRRELLGPQQQRFGDARDEKLSAKGYLAEALHNGKTSLDRLRKLERTLGGDSEEAHPAITLFVNTVASRAAATRVDQGAMLRPSTGNLYTLLGERGTPQQFVGLLTEAMQYGTTALELVALGVWRATREHPEAFGVIDDFDAHEERQRRLQERYAQLCDEARESATVADLALEWIDERKSVARVCLKWNGESLGIGINDDDAMGRLADAV